MGHYSESLDLYARALEEARATGDIQAIPRLEMRVGRLRYQMGDNRGAMVDLQRALELAQGLNDHTRMAICYQSLGDTYFSSGSLPKAIECFMNALHLSEDSDNQTGVAAVCTFLCNAHARAGNFAEAIQYGHRAVVLGEQLRDDRRVAWACHWLCQAYMFMGEFGELDALRARALHLFEKIGDFQGIAAAKSGETWERAIRERNFEKALEGMQHLIQRGRESGGFQHQVSACYARSAEALLRLGRYQEAYEYCQQGLTISLKASNKLEYGYAYMVLAELHATEAYRDWDKAAWYRDESLKAFREAGAKVDVGRAHLAGARIALLRGDGTARRCAETARQIFAEHGATALLKEAEELLVTLV